VSSSQDLASSQRVVERAERAGVPAALRAPSSRAPWSRRVSCVLALTFVLGACGNQPSTPASQSSPNAPMVQTGSAPSFLERIPSAPTSVAYSGTRRAHFEYAVNGVSKTLEYTERVFSDGHGKFTIVPGDVAQPAMDARALEVFRLLQENREAFFFRHRDFCIRDLALFEHNYIVSDLGTQITVCGRPCAWVEVKSRVDGRETYRAAIDPKNGLVMRSEEYSSAGQLLARVEFTDFTLAPDLSGISFHEDIPFEALDLGRDTTPQIGFRVDAPTLIPAAYQLEKADKVEAGGRSWARITYGDGLQEIFVLDSVDAQRSEDPLKASQPAVRAGHTRTSVHVLHIGPWFVAEGEFGPRHLIVMGKAGEPVLLDMLQSALR
jgi:hypothetical protein